MVQMLKDFLTQRFHLQQVHAHKHWTAISNSGLLLHISSGVVLINVILKSWTSKMHIVASVRCSVFVSLCWLSCWSLQSRGPDWLIDRVQMKLCVSDLLCMSHRGVLQFACVQDQQLVLQQQQQQQVGEQMARCAAASGASWPCGATTVPWHMSSVRWTGFLTLKITSFNTWAQI